MLYTGKNNFLFIHIPKCAGTSIEKMFNYDFDNNMQFEHYLKLLPYEHPKHLTLTSYANNLNLDFLKKTFKFTIVRNPFDLYVSLYEYSIKSEKVFLNGKNTYEYKKNISFKTFLEYHYSVHKDKETKLNHKPTSLHKFIYNDHIDLDYIGKFENLEEEIKRIMVHLNINNKLEIHNKIHDKKYNTYQEYYNDITKNYIYEMFENDLKKYNYDF